MSSESKGGVSSPRLFFLLLFLCVIGLILDLNPQQRHRGRKISFWHKGGAFAGLSLGPTQKFEHQEQAQH